MNYCVMVMEYLRLITLSDLVDIVILSFILYKCINLLQWTNAAKVAKVLLIMVACMWVSYQLSLDAINFLLSKAMELGFLALVILFQPEIRRFLELNRWVPAAGYPWFVCSGTMAPAARWNGPSKRRWRPTRRCLTIR